MARLVHATSSALLVLFAFAAMTPVTGVAAQRAPPRPAATPTPPSGGSGTSTAATCATDGSSANIAFTASGTDRVITTNFCPNHAVRTINPNDARENSHFGVTDQRYPVPLAPTLAPAAQRINLTCIPSAIGFSRSGAVFYSVFPGTCGSDAVLLEGDTFDECGGHADRSGMYHYHLTPSCTARTRPARPGAPSPAVAPPALATVVLTVGCWALLALQY